MSSFLLIIVFLLLSADWGYLIDEQTQRIYYLFAILMFDYHVLNNYVCLMDVLFNNNNNNNNTTRPQKKRSSLLLNHLKLRERNTSVTINT